MVQLNLPFDRDLTDNEKHWFREAHSEGYGHIPQPDPPKSPVKGDLKEGLRGGKPALSHMPLGALRWAARAFQYGSSKYERGNYLRPQVDRRADFDRLGMYIDATLRHIFEVTTEMEYMRGNADLDQGPYTLVGGYPDSESKLPHLAHALCSLMMAIQQGINAGILVEDPGTPWEAK